MRIYRNLLSIAPFADTYRVLSTIVTRIIKVPHYKAQRVTALSCLDKAQLLQEAKTNLEDALFILLEEPLLNKLTSHELISICQAHTVLIQEIVKSWRVNTHLENETLMEICHPDEASARCVFLSLAGLFPSEEDESKYRVMLAQTHESIAHHVLNWNEGSFRPFLQGKDIVKLANHRPAIAERILSSESLCCKLTDDEKRMIASGEYKVEISPEIKTEVPLGQLKEEDKFLNFSKIFSRHLQEVENTAIILRLVEKKECN
jgi:hypothetical protein